MRSQKLQFRRLRKSASQLAISHQQPSAARRAAVAPSAPARMPPDRAAPEPQWGRGREFHDQANPDLANSLQPYLLPTPVFLLHNKFVYTQLDKMTQGVSFCSTQRPNASCTSRTGAPSPAPNRRFLSQTPSPKRVGPDQLRRVCRFFRLRKKPSKNPKKPDP